MFFYKQRENSQKMHVFVQRPQKISKKAGSPIRTYPSWSNRLRTGADQTALRAQEPAGSLRQKNKKTQSIENRYPVLVRVTRFEPVACRLRSASRRRIERRFAPKSPLVLCGKRTKKTQSIENRYSALCFHYTIDEHITASDFCNLLFRLVFVRNLTGRFNQICHNLIELRSIF